MSSNKMNIAVIGAGFTGLAASGDLAEVGHQVTVFEASPYPGGLAAGFGSDGWDWSLEHHYHHIFQSDHDIINWVKELGLGDSIFFSDVKSSMLYEGNQFRLDSPISLLKAPRLSLIDKIRVSATLAYLKITPHWKSLEKQTAFHFLKKTMGERAFQMLWEPLLVDKFGQYAPKINAAWFWARIHVRSPQLGYFQGGFGQLAEQIVDQLKQKGVHFQFGTAVKSIIKKKDLELVVDGQTHHFDQILVAAPAQILNGLVGDLPNEYQQQIGALKGLSAMTLVLELNKPFFADRTYWLNVNELEWPFLAVVEHTNLVDPKHYGGKHLLYVGKYLDSRDERFTYTQQQLLEHYTPQLDQLSPGFRANVTNQWLWKAQFAQPVVTVNHSQNVPSLATPIAGLYWASMQHIYPWDRGTNFAVKIGREVAQTMIKHSINNL